MAHVIVLDSINEDIFVCGLCKSVFNSSQNFLDHKSFKCSRSALEESILPITTEIQEAVLTNTLTSNSATSASSRQSTELPDAVLDEDIQTLPQELSCITCKKKFKKITVLVAHMKTHNEKPFQCSICGRCFIQNSHLQRHIPSHKVWPDGLTQTTAKTQKAELLSYTCLYCGIVLSTYSQYRVHLKNHLELKKFKCIQGDCIEFYDSVESLLQHVNASHETLDYCCHLCNSTFNSLEDIATHQHTHNKELTKNKKLFKCTQCDAEFRKSEKLALHMLTENHKKICIHCNKIFASDKRLRLHLHIHVKNKPFRCSICNSSFPMKKNLSAHMLKHGNRQFKCPVCKYMFKRSDLLHRHMRIHQAKKLYKCPFKDSLDCNKEFSRSDKLKLHIKVHTKTMNTASKLKKKQNKQT